MSQNGKEMRNVMIRIGLAMLLYFLLINLLYAGVTRLKDLITNDLFPYSTGAYILVDLLKSVSYVACFLLPAGFYYLISKDKPVRHAVLDARVPEPYTAVKALAVVFIGISVVLLMSTINAKYSFEMSFLGADSINRALDHPYKLVLMFISTVIVPAFVEEMLFRGVVLSNVAPYGKVTAVIISALLFGFMHQNPMQMLYATMAGVFLGTVYLMTGTLWCSILVHMFNNLFAVIVEYLFVVFPLRKADTITMIMELSTLLLGVVFGTICLALRQKEGQREKNSLGMQDKRVGAKEAVRAFLNPVNFCFVLGCTAEMVLVYFLM